MNVVSTDRKKIFYSLKLTDKPLFKHSKEFTEEKINERDLEYKEFSKLDEIVFENQYINTPLKFTSIKSIMLKNCKIDNSNGHLYFDSIENITIENCIFTGTGGRKNWYGGAMWLDNSSETTIIISDSKFSDFDISDYRGGVIYCDSKLKLINCEFNNCYADSGSISYCRSIYIDGCYFSNCKSRLFRFNKYTVNFEEGPNENKFIGCASKY